MLCCVGLFAVFAIGSRLGGPWAFIAPAIGFGLGFMGDTKLMGGSHGGLRSHGGGRCGGSIRAVKKVKTDPVCGMEVNEKTASYKAEFDGKTYHFCSHTCISTFRKDPRRYVK